ncbi:MAG: DUF349 domain-containing protein [Prevotellaceae bacterium]|jgi:hypothetical protein|nr:DUF349 domain-containing protein [Prevotellaceae bacterium]
METEVKKELETQELPTAEQPVSTAEPQPQEQPQAINRTEEQSQTAENDYHSLSKNDLVKKLGELLELSATVVKSDVDDLKQWFYKKHKHEIEEAKKLWQEAGNDVKDFVPTTDEVETKFKELLANFKAKHAETLAKIEAEKERNLQLKEEILEKLKQLTDNIDNIGEAFPKIKELQQEWKNIGAIPQTAVADMWKRFHLYMEKFYDYVNINNELRDYDFKKNLEIKTKLIEAAEKLADEKDVVSASRQLQRLHDEWRESGPVAKEFREEVWNKFKDASAVINKRHQQYFDAIHAQEEANLAEKTRLCEEIDLINATEIATFKDWEEKTARVLELQAEWKKTGFAPKKVNQEIFERFRAACSVFFTKKAEFYRESKETQANNLKKKTALCEKAEAAKENADWKETSDLFIALQKEWKTIGAVPRKVSDELWKRFIAACDYFFEQKAKATSGIRQEQAKNLEAKMAVIEKIKALQPSEKTSEATQALKSLIAEFNSIGHVPFKNKEKTYKAFREAVDKQFEQLNVDIANRRLNYYKTNVVEAAADSPGKLRHESDKLNRQLTQLNADIQTAENNVLFFYSKNSNKKGSSLKDEMERKIEKMKEERNLLMKKIKMLSENA